MRVVLNDGRNIIGRFMAFDRHMNLVLGEAEEFRLIKPKKGKKGLFALFTSVFVIRLVRGCKGRETPSRAHRIAWRNFGDDDS